MEECSTAFFHIDSSARSVVGSQPVGIDPSTGVTDQISYISDIYITIHNSKITVMKIQYNENNFMVGGVTTT